MSIRVTINGDAVDHVTIASVTTHIQNVLDGYSIAEIEDHPLYIRIEPAAPAIEPAPVPTPTPVHEDE